MAIFDPRKADVAHSTNILGQRVSQGSYSAFVPAPLPPELEWTPRLIGALSDADRLVGRLAGEGGRLPNPHILIRPFVQREAVLSSRIEGTQATLGELLAAEAGAIVDRSPEDLREVGNYVVALEHGIFRLKKLSLCVRLTRELHEKLMTGVQGHQAAPGRFRKIQNWIGKPGSTIANAYYIARLHSWISSKSRPASSQQITNSTAESRTSNAGKGSGANWKQSVQTL